MTIAALNWAFQQPVTGPAKAVLIVLADHADQDGWCWPTLARLAFRSGVSERTARRELRNLERDGFIAVEPGVGRGNASRYRLRYPEAVNGADEKGPHRPGNGGKTSHTGPYSESEKGPHRRLKGATPPVKGASVAPEPLLTTIKPRIPPVAPPRAGGRRARGDKNGGREKDSRKRFVNGWDEEADALIHNEGEINDRGPRLRAIDGGLR